MRARPRNARGVRKRKPSPKRREFEWPPVDPKRSVQMARVGSKNTTPERIVRSLLRSMGVRYSIHRKSLPGTPDICVASIKRAILVHGCFWHRHALCGRATTPKVRRKYWLAKFRRNVERDAENRAALRKLGLKVTIVWECECRDMPKLKRRLKALTRPPR